MSLRLEVTISIWVISDSRLDLVVAVGGGHGGCLIEAPLGDLHLDLRMEAEVSLFESCAVTARNLQLCFAEESSARSEFAGMRLASIQL